MRAVVFAAMIAAVAAPDAAWAAVAKVSYLKGKAEVQRAGAKAWKALKKGGPLSDGDTVRTKKRSRVELTFAGGSKVRLGGKSKLKIDEARFTKKKKRKKVGLKLWVGRAWADVAKAAGTFEVKTENAVAGVRGTSFAVFAAADASAVVRVYAGSVGVRAAIGETATRRQVAGPQRIDKGQWQEIIATAMKQVRVSRMGEIAPAEDFTDDGADLEWAKWNRSRGAE